MPSRWCAPVDSSCDVSQTEIFSQTSQKVKPKRDTFSYLNGIKNLVTPFLDTISNDLKKWIQQFEGVKPIIDMKKKNGEMAVQADFYRNSLVAFS